MQKKDQGDIQLTLLENGLDFILSALEHLSGTPQKRDIKYAVLHLCSGIELILKERLRREHWSLVFDEPDNADRRAYETGYFTSVIFKACLKRLTGICGVNIPNKQEQELLEFRNKRNRLEHFGIVDSVESIIATTVSALGFLIDFINTELAPENLNDAEADALASIRQKLGDFEAFVLQRWDRIEEKLEHAGTAVVTCPSCTQDAALLDDGASCLFCGYKASAEDAADHYIFSVLGESYHQIMKEGGEWPRYMCPECDMGTLVDCGPSGNQYPSVQFVCFSCGESWKEGQLDDFCSSCGQPYKFEDMPICNECFEAKVRSER